jgi:hypothetical protein
MQMNSYEYYDLSISQYEERLLHHFPTLEQLQEIPNPYSCIRASRFSSLWSYTAKIYHLFEELKEPNEDLSASEQTYLMENYLTYVFETCHYIDGQTNEDDKNLFYSFVFPFLSQLGDDLYSSNPLLDEVFFSVLPRTAFIGAFAIHSYSMAFNDERGIVFVMREIFADAYLFFLRQIKDVMDFITNFFDDHVEDSSQESSVSASPLQVSEPEPDHLAHIVVIDNKSFPMLKRCTSCFEEHIQEYVVTSCRHTACKACALKWLGVHQTCWYCRQVVSEHSPVYCYSGNPSCKEEDMIEHVI